MVSWDEEIHSNMQQDKRIEPLLSMSLRWFLVDILGFCSIYVLCVLHHQVVTTKASKNLAKGSEQLR